MASSVRLTMGPIPHGPHKSKEGARRRRVHVLLGVLALGLVGALGTILAKRGFPDIDPVKVRPLRFTPSHPRVLHPACPTARASSLVRRDSCHVGVSLAKGGPREEGRSIGRMVAVG